MTFLNETVMKAALWDVTFERREQIGEGRSQTRSLNTARTSLV